jgi:hypothetical protein
MNFRNKLIFYGEELSAQPPSCPRLLIQYIRSYPPYLEAVSSIRKLRTRHAVVTRDTPYELQTTFQNKRFKRS